MIRRITISILILALLVQNSVVACAHVHSSDCGSDDSLANRPHVHLAMHSSCNHEPHHHQTPNCCEDNGCQRSGDDHGDFMLLADFVAILPAIDQHRVCVSHYLATSQLSAISKIWPFERHVSCHPTSCSLPCAIYLQICALLI